jgi:hypothetical protein
VTDQPEHPHDNVDDDFDDDFDDNDDELLGTLDTGIYSNAGVSYTTAGEPPQPEDWEIQQPRSLTNLGSNEGWYRDPVDAEQLRWWTGSEWGPATWPLNGQRPGGNAEPRFELGADPISTPISCPLCARSPRSTRARYCGFCGTLLEATSWTGPADQTSSNCQTHPPA